jgi:hypothetical protein
MAQTAINAINLDIAPDQFDKLVEAAKENLQRRRRTTACSLRSMTMRQPSTFTEPRIMSRNARRPAIT